MITCTDCTARYHKTLSTILFLTVLLKLSFDYNELIMIINQAYKKDWQVIDPTSFRADSLNVAQHKTRHTYIYLVKMVRPDGFCKSQEGRQTFRQAGRTDRRTKRPPLTPRSDRIPGSAAKIFTRCEPSSAIRASSSYLLVPPPPTTTIPSSNPSHIPLNPSPKQNSVSNVYERRGTII